MLSMKQFVGVLAAVTLLACGSVAQATSFTFNPQPNTPGAYPDITFGLQNLSYNAATGALTACGQATKLRTSASAFENLTDVGCNGTGFTLSANITAGVNGTLNSGTVSVVAGDAVRGIAPGTLIFSAQIKAFNFVPCFNGSADPLACQKNEAIVKANPSGYNHASLDPNAVGATLDFLLQVVSDPFNLGFNVGKPAGIQIATDNVFTSDFTQSFLNRTSSNASDLFRQAVVPEPSSLLLLGTGVALLFRRRLARGVTRTAA